MKKRIGAVLVLLAALLVAVCLGACSYGAGPNTGQDEADDTKGFDDFVPDLYVANYSYGFWDQITSGLEADFAIGDWNTTLTMDDVGSWIRITVGSGATSAGWSGGTLAQVPDTAAGGSYYDFSKVATITFSVRGSLSAGSVKMVIENTAGTKPVNEVSITSYGVSSLSQTTWATATMNMSSITAIAANQKIKGAFSFTCGTAAGWVEFKDIAFLDTSGASVDIASTVTYK